MIISWTEEPHKNMDSDSSDDYDNCYFTEFYKHTYHRKGIGMLFCALVPILKEKKN